MIKVHFFDWGIDNLDVENELGIHYDVIDFLTETIPSIRFEATDNEADLPDNWIFWFSSEDEHSAAKDIYQALSSMIKPDSKMGFTVTAAQW